MNQGPCRLLLVVLLLLFFGISLGACGRSPEAWTDEGDRMLRANDLEGAERAYNRALAKDPHYAPAVYGKGWALYASGFDVLQDTAQQLFSRAIDYDPDFYGGYRGRGVLLLEEGNIPAAEGFLRQAWERAPEEPTVVESMGQLYLRAGHLVPARKAFTEAVRLAPGRGELRRFLADVALAEGDFDRALVELDIGRESPISGKRGLLLLDEGEVFVHSAAARALLEGKLGDGVPDPLAAAAALDAASLALARMEAAGFVTEAAVLRSDRITPLRKRVAAGSDVTPLEVAPLPREGAQPP
jgi:tetratricopeptide (TPR) repeat protein